MQVSGPVTVCLMYLWYVRWLWKPRVARELAKQDDVSLCENGSQQPPEVENPEKPPTDLMLLAKAAGMTLLSTFLSLTFLGAITSIDPDSWQPCHDAAAGCLYQKTFASGGVGATEGYFASVQNGNETIVGLSADHSWAAEHPWQAHSVMPVIAGLTYLFAMIFGWSTHQPPALCPNMTASEMRSYCAAVETKTGVQNHLLGPGIWWLIALTVVWGLLRICHDCLLLLGRSEPAAYAGMAAVAAQVSAALTAAYWASGSTSVFVSLHSTADCACFISCHPSKLC